MTPSVVGARPDVCESSSLELANMDVVQAFLDLPKPIAAEDRARLFAPDYQLRRIGMTNLVEMLTPTAGMSSHLGYLPDSFRDRRDELVDIVAKNDVVWVLFRLRGTHTGDFWGSPGTGRTLDCLELAIFRLSQGKICEAWFMNDELALCRQLGLIVPRDLTGNANAGGQPSAPPDDRERT